MTTSNGSFSNTQRVWREPFYIFIPSINSAAYPVSLRHLRRAISHTRYLKSCFIPHTITGVIALIAIVVKFARPRATNIVTTLSSRRAETRGYRAILIFLCHEIDPGGMMIAARRFTRHKFRSGLRSYVIIQREENPLFCPSTAGRPARVQGNAANPMNYRRCPPISCINANAGCYRIVEQGQIERRGGGPHSLTILHAVILQPRNGLLMHYSSANATPAARVAARCCCALTCPKLPAAQRRSRETSEELHSPMLQQSEMLGMNAVTVSQYSYGPA